MNLDLAN